MKMRFQDFGKGSPLRNDLKSWRAALGLNNGTSCPAPLTVAKVSPSYTSVQPPTFIKNRKTFHIILHRDFDNSELGIFFVHVQLHFFYMKLTWFLTYHGYHGTFVLNFSCEMEYLVAVTGTTESTSPLKIISTNLIIGCLIKYLKEMEDSFLAWLAWFIDGCHIT